MGGAFLDDYLYPLFGLMLLALGAWSTWAVWRPGGPSLAARVAALILGGVAGWCLANLAHAEGVQEVTIGFPMPVLTLVKGSGHWLELAGSPSLPCLLLDLAVGVGLLNALLHVFHERRSRPAPRRGLRVPAARRELAGFEDAPAQPAGRDS